MTSSPPGDLRAGRTRGSRRRRRGRVGDEQIFVDTSGRRKRWTRRAVLALCIPLVGYLGLLAIGVVSSSPLGTPPWIADQPAKPAEQKPAGGDAGASPGSSGAAQPGKASKTPRPSASASPGKATTGATTAPGAGSQTSAAVTVPPTGPGNAPTLPPGSAPTSDKPGNGPAEPPGQSRRPTASNTNKGGH